MRYLIIFIMLFLLVGSLVGCSKSIDKVEYKDTTYGEMFNEYQYFNQNAFKDKKIASNINIDVLKLDPEENTITQYTLFDEDNNFQKLYFVYSRKDVTEKIEFSKEEQLEILEKIYNDKFLISSDIVFNKVKDKINPHITEKLESIASDLINKFF